MFDCIWPQIKNSNQYQVLTKDANQITGCSKPQQVTHISVCCHLLLQCQQQHPSTLGVALKTLTSLFSPLSVSFCNLHIAFLPCITSHVFSNPLTFHSRVPTAESKAGALPRLHTQYNCLQLLSSFRRDKQDAEVLRFSGKQ